MVDTIGKKEAVELNVIRDIAGATVPVAQVIQSNVGNDQYALYVKQYGTAQALRIENYDNTVIKSTAAILDHSAGDTLHYVTLCASGDAHRRTALFYRNLDSTKTGNPMVFIHQDNLGDDQSALYIKQDGVAQAIYAINSTTVQTAYFGNNEKGISTNVVTLANGSTASRCNYFFRDLAATDTNGPVVVINQDNINDDQVALYIKQDAPVIGLQVEGLAAPSTFLVGIYAAPFSDTTNANYCALKATAGQDIYGAAYLGRGAQNSSATHYFIRDLASTDTNCPVCKIWQKSTADDQFALRLVQYGTSASIFAENINTANTAYAGYFMKNVSGVSASVLYVSQEHITAGVAALLIKQDDISEGFINFMGSDRGIITGATNSTESVRVEINGVIKRIALFADA